MTETRICPKSFAGPPSPIPTLKTAACSFSRAPTGAVWSPTRNPNRIHGICIVVLHPLVVHGSGENKTDEDRIALMGLYRKPKNDMSDLEKKASIEILRE